MYWQVYLPSHDVQLEALPMCCSSQESCTGRLEGVYGGGRGCSQDRFWTCHVLRTECKIQIRYAVQVPIYHVLCRLGSGRSYRPLVELSLHDRDETSLKTGLESRRRDKQVKDSDTICFLSLDMLKYVADRPRSEIRRRALRVRQKHTVILQRSNHRALFHNQEHVKVERHRSSLLCWAPATHSRCLGLTTCVSHMVIDMLNVVEYRRTSGKSKSSGTTRHCYCYRWPICLSLLL